MSVPGIRVLLSVLATGLAVGAAVAAVAPEPQLMTWRRDVHGVVSGGAGSDLAVPVGSLLKPFVAQAWAAAHPGRPTPRWHCDGRGCWRRSGHGTVGLVRATALSCNAAFLALAADTPPAVLRSTFEAEGFVVAGAVTPQAAVGLEDGVAVAPASLLAAYARLTRRPWTAGETVRLEILAGLRQAAQDGTARGVGRSGVWAKTGTVEDPDRRGLSTIGWTVAVDDSGSAVLARLRPGTGREAAAALGRLAGAGILGAARTDEGDRVRVLLFTALRPRSVRATNGETGETVWLSPGQPRAEGVWRLSLPGTLERAVKAALTAERGPDGSLQVIAEMDAREYVSGMIAAELPDGSRSQRIDLGAAALRLRARGPRHAGAHFCDTTHCATFIGRGPMVRWPSPHRAVMLDRAPRPVDDEEWARMVGAARRPGPVYWTSHCGGHPLSEYAVWGRGDRQAPACPLHAGAPARPWTRFWSDEALARALGARVDRAFVSVEDTVQGLTVESGGRTRRLLYDEAHRALASVLGWDALPSPPDRIVRAPGGFRAFGVGAGHRVGLCLDASWTAENR